MKLSLENLDVIISDLYYKKIHSRIPGFLKKPISAFMDILINFISLRIKFLYLPVYIVQGKNKEERNFKILYIGQNYYLIALSNLLFTEEPIKKSLGKCFISKIKHKVNLYSDKVDAVFIQTDIFFSNYLQKKGFITLPVLIHMRFNIPKHTEKINQKFLRSAQNDMKLIRKCGYTYEVTSDLNKLDYFFNELYIPYIYHRHGRYIWRISEDYLQIKNLFNKNGRLLLVKDKDKYISGGIFLVNNKNNTVDMLHIGMLNDSYYRARGVGSAIYYFTLIWAKENGFFSVGFGLIPPFLNYGNFKFKRKWGAEIKRIGIQYGICGFKIYNFKEKRIREFFEQNPFVYHEKNFLKGMVFFNHELKKEDVDYAYKHYYTPGITNLTIVSLDAFNEDLQKYVEINYGKKIVLKNMESKNERYRYK